MNRGRAWGRGILSTMLCVWFLLPTLCAGLSYAAPPPSATPPGSSSCHESAPAPKEQPPAKSPKCCVTNQHQQAAVTTSFYLQCAGVPGAFARIELCSGPPSKGAAIFQLAPVSPPRDVAILRI